MIQSYQEEIRAKRIAARIFWLVVFVFAGFLYFFFQGYYPSIDFRLTNITGSGNVSGEERGVSIRSFGIVNVKASPLSSILTLNNNSYGNDEKKMVDYGDYTLNISGEAYLPSNLHFSINREKSYYIDSINLVRRPTYARYQKHIDQISKIDTDTWIARSEPNILLFEKDFSAGVLIASWSITPIGEWRFLSGNTIVSYDLLTHAWVREASEEWESFSEKCSSVAVKNTFLFCREEGKALSTEGKIFTGILDIRKEYIRTSLGIIPFENERPKKLISFSGITVDSDTQFISIENRWYFTRSGSLITLTGERSRIITPLDSIRHIEWIGTNLLVFGQKWPDTFLTFLDTNNPLKTRTIPFPDIPLEELRIWESQGNLFIKTKRALLLVYRGSDETHWMVDGEILALWEDFAIYKKDDELWETSWKTPEAQ